MKKIIALFLLAVICFSFSACGEEQLSETITKEGTTKLETTKPELTRYTKTCIECGKQASKTYTNPFSNKVENYCYTHYYEIISIMGEMEEDVGNGLYSKHTCEECSREGIHSYEGFTGETEYYCTEHYEELKAMLSVFGLN